MTADPSLFHDDPQKTLSIHSKAVPDAAWKLHRLWGREALSRIYEFELDIVSEKTDLDFDEILSNPVTLQIHSKGTVRPIHGVFSSFEIGDQQGKYVLYRARLVPKLWYLSLSRHNRVFQDKTVRELVAQVLDQHGLTADLEDRCGGSYPKLEFVVQYEESDLNFISRHLEHYGIFYFWEQGRDGAKLVLGDGPAAHRPIWASNDQIAYQSGNFEGLAEDVISQFSASQEIVPKTLVLRDYNYRSPALDLTGKAPVDKAGHGLVMSYGSHVKDEREAERLAHVRAEELLAERRRFGGETRCSGFAPGALFTLTDHFRKRLNGKYLIVDVSHEAQEAIEGLPAERPGHTCRFAAICGDVSFRPLRQAEKPRIYGVMHAIIDSAGSGEYADLDEQGRYRVRLPLDSADAVAGRASRPIRMLQPYAGAEYGMHFPLHKGTEVLLSFIDGDVDRPIIAGAVPNPVTKSPVAAKNQTRSVILTAGGNLIELDDEKGKQGIKIYTPQQKTLLKLGAPDAQLANEGYTLATEKDAKIAVKGEHDEFVQKDMTVHVGGTLTENIDGSHKVHIGHDLSAHVKGKAAETVTIAKATHVGGAYAIDVGGAFGMQVGGAWGANVGGDLNHLVAGAITEQAGKWKAEKVLGKKTVSVSKSCEESVGEEHHHTVGKEYKLAAKEIAITAEEKVVLQCGAGKISIEKDGTIQISGVKVEIEAQAQQTLKGATVELESSGPMTVKGMPISLN